MEQLQVQTASIFVLSMTEVTPECATPDNDETWGILKKIMPTHICPPIYQQSQAYDMMSNASNEVKKSNTNSF